MKIRNKSLGMWHRIWLFFLLGTSNSRKIVGNVDHQWLGNGTSDSPYIVSWPVNDALNGRNYGTMRKISIIVVSGLSTLSVAFASSAYSGDLSSICQYFGVSDEAATLGLSLYVLGFAIGLLLWAPMSEAFGRRIVFLATFSLFTIFNIAAAISANFASLVIFRALAGMFGSAPLTNSGGVVADLYSAETRGLAAVFYSCATFLGPVLGPIAGGFLGKAQGWRWVEGLLAIYSGIMLILGILCVPETFSNVLLRRRAAMLSMQTGKLYVSSVDHRNPPGSLAEKFQVSTTRPLHLLSNEPILVVLALYMSFLYGTTYLLLAALPIVFQRVRGWSPGMGGLAFVPIAIGMLFATAFMVFINRQYTRKFRASETGQLPPEARLPSGKVGAALIPTGLFLFAWTNDPSINWAVCMVGISFFGFGNICVTLALVNYLVDSYVTSAASALAAATVMRSLCGATFPLFTTYMYDELGIHWASSVPACLSLACLPAPYLLSKFGPRIRRRSKFATIAMGDEN
ncbi:major facilitator superfamily domain-containing protein [Aspergillus pseudotamarii]|uniref:Major facilitator superfamily domain-containing protein n=1 Tax=Aspergillus pseudotamarii TaxID=132259 RepID=A0A5N6SUR0_ASPPS|nr:major facilitator superfamily domain-containing protein [Aspergillus pseudotamarii]KAE8137123.1 major facilitator superfamily domain-containing protein [Aspergillus pseudotamarii]